MTKHELINEIKRLDEVIGITARRLDAHKKEAEGKTKKPFDLSYVDTNYTKQARLARQIKHHAKSVSSTLI
jgi:hypothetical protein